MGLDAQHRGRLLLSVLGVVLLLASASASAGIIHTSFSNQLSQPRENLAATAVGDEALFAGGLSSSGTEGPKAGVDIYDASSGGWSTASLSVARGLLAATSVGTKALFGGGRTKFVESDTEVSTVDICDASTGTWSTASLSVARDSLAATGVGNLALFAGGSAGGYASGAVDIYNATTNTWSIASLSACRHSLAAISVGNLALFAGGYAEGEASRCVDIYNASTGTWSTASLARARYDLAATTAGGLAFFAGGRDAYGMADTTVDIYDPATDKWRPASLSVGRTNLSATGVGDFAFFGGGGGSTRVDIYQVSTDTWYQAELPVLQTRGAATSVGNRAIFAGGVGGTRRVDIFEVTDTSSWTGATGGWSDIANWDSVVGPLVADHIFVNNGGTAQVATAGVQGEDLTLGQGPAESGTVEILPGGSLTLSGNAAVGAGGTGHVIQSGGSLTVAGGLYVSGLPGSYGTYTLSGGSLEVGDEIAVGLGNSGALSVQNGQVAAPLMSVTDNGMLTFTGGTITVEEFQNAGAVTWTGGTLNVTGSGGLVVGDSGLPAINVDADMALNVTGPLSVRSGATLGLSGGTVTAASLTIGGATPGRIDWNGGTLDTPTIQVGTAGVLTVGQNWTYAGSLEIAGGTVGAGTNGLTVDSGGSIEITGSTLAAGQLVVGDAGSATVIQSGGTAPLGGLQLGFQPTGDGTYALSGGAAVTLGVTGNAVVGAKGSGRFMQTGGVHTVGGELRIGRDAGSAGIYELSGGELAVTSFGIVGWSGQGSFQQSGGTYNAGGRLYLGYRAAGIGSYELSGTGVLSAAAGEQIGCEGTGVFTQTGGTHEVTGSLVLGYATGADGSYTMQAGTLDVSSTLRVGRDGSGRLELAGGAAAADSLEIGSSGVVLFTGGTLTIDSLVNNGTFTWGGGILNVSGAGGLTVGSGQLPSVALGASHTLNVTNELTVSPGHLLALTGGSLSCGALALNNGIIAAPGGLSLDSTGDLTGSGTVVGPVSGGATRLITVQGGSLTLGDSGSAAGFSFAGALDVGSNLLTLLDADRAQLGSGTILAAGGEIHAGNGLDLGSAAFLLATGAADIRGDFTNDGTVNGPTAPGEYLVFYDDVNGDGSFTGNIEFRGLYSPGHSPGQGAFDTLALAASGVLLMEAEGTTPGTECDFLDVAGDLTLTGGLRVWFSESLAGQLQDSDALTVASIGGTLTGQFANAAPGDLLVSDDGLLRFRVYYGTGSPFGSDRIVLSDFSPVPEPATMLLFGSGLAVIFHRRRRRPA